MHMSVVSLIVFVLILVLVPLSTNSSCAPIWEYASKSLKANANSTKTLILIPYSGWGDFVRALANGLLLSIIEGANFKLHSARSTKDPRLAEWECLPDQLTLTTRSGFKYGVGQPQLKQIIPLWEVVKTSIATALDHRFVPFTNITIVKDARKCVCILASTVTDVHFADTTCQWTMSKNPKVGVQREENLASTLNVPPWKLRQCLMRFGLQFLPTLEQKANTVLEQLKQPEMSGNVVVIGIHIRAMRYYIQLHPDIKTQQGVAVDNVFAEDARRSTHVDKLSQLDVDLEEFDSFARAAQRLEENYKRVHNDGTSLVFKWIIFSDSRPLRAKLQQRWDHAVDLDLGEPSHNGCTDGGLARVEWLILSKCDMLVITDSGFSRSAAMFALPTPPIAVVFTGRGKVRSYFYFDGNLTESR
eukprot:m.66978 g.66978  ORF g.66978 m.66978 type:complete len:416 (-) comp23752_c0_seq2:58-1305(-)